MDLDDNLFDPARVIGVDFDVKLGATATDLEVYVQAWIAAPFLCVATLGFDGYPIGFTLGFHPQSVARTRCRLNGERKNRDVLTKLEG